MFCVCTGFLEFGLIAAILAGWRWLRKWGKKEKPYESYEKDGLRREGSAVFVGYERTKK